MHVKQFLMKSFLVEKSVFFVAKSEWWEVDLKLWYQSINWWHGELERFIEKRLRKAEERRARTIWLRLLLETGPECELVVDRS